MRNRAEEIRAGLEAEWPGWHVWIVWRAVGGPLWCARPRDCSGPPLSFGDPDTLAWEIEQREEN
jgi:hypothetical protein